MTSQIPMTDIIQRRSSCRSYTGAVLDPAVQTEMETFLSGVNQGPFGSRLRFSLAAAEPGDNAALKELGTYGFIKGAGAYIIGAVTPAPYDLEDYGYAMETIILHATSLDLGTCWLGGSFNRSGFSRKIACTDEECVPAVAALGYCADKRRVFDSTVRMIVGATKRKAFQDIFFDRDFARPLNQDQCGPFATPLAMIRLAPSASNKQPWRIIRDKDPNVFHLYLERTKNYYKSNKRIFSTMDIQRIDMGIAMCHFDLACQEADIKGTWSIDPILSVNLPLRTSYVATWRPNRS